MNTTEDDMIELIDTGYDVPDPDDIGLDFANGFEAYQAWIAMHEIPTPVEEYYRVLKRNAHRIIRAARKS